jgi:hypothetical protein
MPFDWMEPKRNPAHTKTLAAKREAMYRSEIEDRAALLHRLGHSRARVKARLVANMGWDFEQSARPIADGQVDAILDRVFGGAKSAPRTKGGSK